MGKYEIACSILIIKALWIPHHIPNYKKRSKEIEKDLLSIHQTNFQVNHFTALLTWMQLVEEIVAVVTWKTQKRNCVV